MITPEMKDRLLNFLIENAPQHPFPRGGDGYTDIPWMYIEMILNQFHKRGFITIRLTKEEMDVTLTADAYDFAYHGGFVAQEENLMNNLRKLELEVQKLQSTFPEKVATFATILGGISSYLGLFNRPH